MRLSNRHRAGVVTGLLASVLAFVGCTSPSPRLINIEPTWSFRTSQPQASAESLWPDATYRQAYVDGVAEYHTLQAASVAW